MNSFLNVIVIAVALSVLLQQSECFSTFRGIGQIKSFNQELKKKELSWQDARMSCNNSNGDLAMYSMRRYNVRKFMATFLEVNTDVWVGIYSPFGNNTFTWLNGDPVKSGSYQWYEGQPNNVNSTRNCGVLLNDGYTFKAEDCNAKHPSICEVPRL